MYDAHTQAALGRGLAAAFLAGTWDLDGLTDRGRSACDRAPRWLGPCARAVLSSYPRPPADRPRELAAFLAAWLAERRDARSGARAPRIVRWHLPTGAMGPAPWPVPSLPSLAELAAFLELSDGALAWLADARGAERLVEDEALRNYRYTWLPRGAGPPRLVERPKPRLKAVQRLILRQVLAPVPPHPAAHGFVPGRSARTHAAEHTGRHVVLRLDLEDFFASIPASRVYGIYRTAGYPEAVAHLLTALATNVVPADTWAQAPPPADPRRHLAHFRLGRRLATPHLPQGAPTSPALANLAAFGLDRRLTGLAAAFGARYTRYADDLTFSGGRLLLERAGPVRDRVAAIARDAGFRVNAGKSQLMPRAGRQRLCGIVVNARPNVTRREYDELKAILHNAARSGPESQNRAAVPGFRAHLLGRIAWIGSLHPERGARLRASFERIAWDADS